MLSLVSYTIKRWLRIWDSRCTPRKKEVEFRGRTFRFHSTYWWSDVSQDVFDTEIAPYFEALESDFSPVVIIDVGAATGHFAIVAAELFPGSIVYAFEPSARQRILLARNARLNRVHNIRIQALGLWKSKGRLPFRSNGAESSFETVSRFQGNLPFLERVEVTTLDHWMPEKKLLGIDLIKMDAEGAELEILDGARVILQKFTPRLLIQAYHLRDGLRTFERCAELLGRLGYDVEDRPPGPGFLCATEQSASNSRT